MHMFYYTLLCDCTYIKDFEIQTKTHFIVSICQKLKVVEITYHQESPKKEKVQIMYPQDFDTNKYKGIYSS